MKEGLDIYNGANSYPWSRAAGLASWIITYIRTVASRCYKLKDSVAHLRGYISAASQIAEHLVYYS